MASGGQTEAGRSGVAWRRDWAVVLPAMVLPTVGALCYFVWFADSGAARLAYGATKVFTLGWPALAVWGLLREPWPRLDGWHRHGRALVWGALVGLGLLVGLVVLAAGPLAGVLAAGEPQIQAKAEAFKVAEHYWLFGGLMSTFHAGIEEYYWRWFVYGRLRRLARGAWAHGLAGAAFAGHHVVVASVYVGLGWGVVFGALVGLAGVLWSVMYQRQGTLAGAWLAHLGADAGLMFVGHRLLFGTWC